MERMKETKWRLAGLEQEAWQPGLATEAGVKPHIKTRKRMEDIAADRVISGDNSSAQVNPDPMCLTSFGDDFTGPPALPCSRDDALVDKGAAAPKTCLFTLGDAYARPVQRLGGGRGCNLFVPVLGGNGTKIAPTGDIFDQPPGQMR